jgi:hypothetical protein
VRAYKDGYTGIKKLKLIIKLFTEKKKTLKRSTNQDTKDKLNK